MLRDWQGLALEGQRSRRGASPRDMTLTVGHRPEADSRLLLSKIETSSSFLEIESVGVV